MILNFQACKLIFSICISSNPISPIVGKSHVVLKLKNIGKTSITKVCYMKLNTSLIDLFQKYVLYSDFQCGFRSSRSFADLLTVECDRTARSLAVMVLLRL